MSEICKNCLIEDAVTEVSGYDVCQECADKAGLPWYLRD